MVVNVLVYIEGREDVKCVAKVNLPWNNHVASEDWEKVSTTDYEVHMFNRHDPILGSIEIGFNNPHTIVGVRVVEGFVKVVNKRT